jgi:serine/threonine-protein kinase
MVTRAAHPQLTARVVLALIAALFSVFFSRGAAAQNATNSAAAQALFDRARDLMKAGNYAEACPKLEESQRLDPGSGTLMNLGVCYEHQGLTASAWTTFLETVTASRAAGKPDRAKSAQQYADALAPKLARLTIRVSTHVPGIEVRRDDAVVRQAQLDTAIPIDPGKHTVSAKAPGFQPWQTTITLHDASNETVVVPDLEKAPSPAPVAVKAAAPASDDNAKRPPPKPAGETAAASSLGTQRIAALIVGSVGVAGIAVGSVFGIRSKAAHDQAEPYCNEGGCTSPLGVDYLQDARTAGNISTAAFVLGAVGVGAGAVLWFTAPNGVQMSAGLGTVQLRGTF